MAKKRKNGQGTVRLRSDGRWEGRHIVGYDENGKAKFYIAAGTYTISAAKQGVGSYSKILRVYDESKTIEIQIKGNNSGSSEEKKGIKIDENTFPDKNFREYILENIDKDGDGYLSET